MMKHANREIHKRQMKPENHFRWMVISLFFTWPSIHAQFIGTETDSLPGYTEVRKGSVVEYSLENSASPGDAFRWEVTGGTISTPGATGTGTPASPSVLEFETDRHSIEVQWQADDSTAAFFDGELLVQKLPAGGCASPVTRQAVRQWSIPTASIDDSLTDFFTCSGDFIGGYLVVHFTGAAGFTLNYSIKSNGLKDETGNAINTEHRTVTTMQDTTHIPLPGRLVNPSEAASKYFTIELTAMHDDFLGDGNIVAGREAFTITVYPSVKTGTIHSTKLNRR